MIPVSRRSLTSSRLSSPSLLSSFVIGSSKDLDLPSPRTRAFSVSPLHQNNPRTRPTKAKLQELATKVDRKRAVKESKAVKNDAKVAQARVGRIQKELELEHKRLEGQALAEGLPPLSDLELEGIYRGLLEAKPDELALPALVAPAAPLLLGASSSAINRRERLAELEDRLDTLERMVEDIEEPMEDGAEEEEVIQRTMVESALAKRLQKRRGVEVVEEEAEITMDAETTSSLGRKLLDRVERVAPKQKVANANGESSTPAPPMGLFVPSEWRDLVLLCAEEGDATGVEKALSLMQRTSPVEDAGLLTEAMAQYASKGLSREALSLANFARSSAPLQNLSSFPPKSSPKLSPSSTDSIPLSVSTHHHLLSSLLPSHPELAIKHLHSLESASYTPLLETYTLLISSLLSPSTPSYLTSRGWDLFAHTRLVSHPTPSPELYATMISACARGDHPSPERAVDLFTEMTEDNGIAPTAEAYNGLIRSCARRGTQEYYFEALRFMRQMLDQNIPPSRQTFHAVLEGARRQGDLPRARWMLVKMVGVGEEAAPDSSSLGLVFQTYAAFQPVEKQAGGRKRGKGKVVQAETEAGVDAPIDTSTPTPTPNMISTETVISESPESSRMETQGLVDLLGESSLFYPGPLPQTTDELLLEAHNLMSQCIPPHLLSTTSTSDSTPPHSSASIFPSVVPTTFLLNSYLSILATHAPFDTMMEFWNTVYEKVGVEKNRFGFECVMRRLEVAKNRVRGTEVAREVFEEWKAWEASEKKEGEATEVEEGGDGEDLERPVESGKGRKSGRNISLMYASMIRILSRSYADTEALALFQSFITQYPPQHIVTKAEYAREAARLFPKSPSLIRLSSPLYPETRSSSISSSPPYLVFDQVRLLHMRMAEVENVKGVATVKAICKAYEGALKEAKEVEEGTTGRNQRNKKKEDEKRMKGKVEEEW